MSTVTKEDLEGPTIILIGINFIMFLITSIIGGAFLTIGSDALVIFGLSLQNIGVGYLWAPLTSIFTHAGIVHLGGNMIFLAIYGFKLEEERFNDKQIYLAYLITGIGAGLFSMFIITGFQVGASGSVFGILGVYYGYSRRRKDVYAKRVLYTSIILFLLASSPGTNVFAHLIGLALGVLVGSSEEFYHIK